MGERERNVCKGFFLLWTPSGANQNKWEDKRLCIDIEKKREREEDVGEEKERAKKEKGGGECTLNYKIRKIIIYCVTREYNIFCIAEYTGYNFFYKINNQYVY